MNTLAMIRALEEQGYDVRALLAQHQEKSTEALSSERVTDADRAYSVPVVAPSATDHLGLGEGTGLPVTLRADRLWAGYHYTLTPGQRKWFREVMGLTPSETVTVDWVQVFLGTQHPCQFKIRSDQHLAGNRKHLLTAAVVPAARFFAESARFDSEIAEERAAKAAVKKVKKDVEDAVIVPGGVKSKAVTLDELMAELKAIAGQ